ncbi:hypothetical protein BN2475_440003 [Paraburkholderia ribeironis]|uniref:Uncharacterized protein n=1 Tax=Paraburkholderia ribeironis TaxID=1247936 RepID=A0A1N7S856_9BURK|nr:hypothetical protein BN2475_440003 [Paraburkholderia ribeironis]
MNDAVQVHASGQLRGQALVVRVPVPWNKFSLPPATWVSLTSIKRRTGVHLTCCLVSRRKPRLLWSE